MAEHMAYLRRQSDGETWRPDAVVRFSAPRTLSVTTHPVEEGVTVADHVQRQPTRISIECVLTENPVGVGGATGGRVHVKELLDWLRETAELDNPLVDVVTVRDGVYTDFAIVSIPADFDNVSRVRFTLELQEIRVATATTVLISVEDVDDYEAEDADTATASGAPDEVDVGEQATTSTDTDPEAEEADKSALASLLDAL